MMKKIILIVSVIALLLAAGCMPVTSRETGNVSVVVSPAEENKTVDLIACTPESRQGDMCIELYDPVCGEKEDDEKKTYSNSCFACLDKIVKGYSSGECPPGKE